ncbi:MAG: hypothetical protein OXE95_06430 [Chloroflexi bacterium]|nr:hypothetical protein [Chloroflexota bacterium]MCY4247197.1 hypothetical protein [Chloroflexota bacterium]
MKSPRGLGVWLLLLLLLTGCAASAVEQTAATEQSSAETAIAQLRATSTVARARMQTTLDYAGSRVTEAAEAQEFLRFNLISLGTESAWLSTAIGQLGEVGEQATATAQPAAIGTDAAPSAPSSFAVIVTPPTPQRSGPRLENVLMASGVDSRDCAIDNNPRFTPASSQIYVVAQAYNVLAGATISSVWRRQDSEVAKFSFQPRNNLDGDCIWFFIDQSDAEFTVGAWSVEVTVDDILPAPSLAFQIVPG